MTFLQQERDTDFFENYDQCTHSLGKLDIGRIVRAQHLVTKRWSEFAEVVGQDQRGRSY